MKIQNPSRWPSLLIFIMVVSGCMPSTEGVATSSTSLSTTPTTAPSPVGTIAPTLTPVATDTPTTVPTLLVDQARQHLLDLLANNGSCHLPCLWGITPGQSTSQDAQASWSPLSSIQSIYDIEPSFGSERGHISPDYVEGDLMLHTKVHYLSENQIISNISFKAWEWQEYVASNGSPGLASIFDSQTFGQRTAYYSLADVLSKQGKPASVMISTSGPPQIYIGGGGFYIVLLYPDKGIWVNYTTQMYVVGSSVRGCPADAHIEMELYPPGNPDSFFALLEKTDWGVKKIGYKPLEEVTSMSVQEFYDAFRKPTDKCIETPAKLWPTPEP